MTAQITQGSRGLAGLGRLAIVRLLVFAVVLIGAYIALQVVGSLVIPRAPGAAHDAMRLLVAAVMAPVMFGLYVLLVRRLERRLVTELRPGRRSPQVLGGVTLGAGLFVAVYVVLGAIGVVRIDGAIWDPRVLVSLAAAVAAAVAEELALRGGVYRIIEDACGTTVALLFSGGLFGLLHAANPGATLVSSLSIAFEAGVLLGLAYALTRSLWLPIGLHLGWNFTEGGVFGAAVLRRPLPRPGARLRGPALNLLLDRRPSALKASVVAVGLSLLVSVVMAAAVVRRGHWKPLTWRMRLP